MNLRTREILKIEELDQLCEKHKVARLYLFGSALGKGFKPGKSDLDFLVEMQEVNPVERGENLIELWNDLEKLYGFEIDLLTAASLSNPVLHKEVEASKTLIYESGAEVSA